MDKYISSFSNLFLNIEIIFKNQVSEITSTIESRKRKNYQNTVYLEHPW